MKAAEFKELFIEEVADPLLSSGFQFARGTQSLFLQQGTLVFSLVRLGGKFSSPGRIAHICAIRHTFLRNLEKEPVRSWNGHIFEHPFKIRPENLAEFGAGDWKYRPMNLRFQAQYLSIETPEADLRSSLTYLRQLLQSEAPRILNLLTPLRCLQELEEHGEDAFCERIWIADYKAQARCQSGED